MKIFYSLFFSLLTISVFAQEDFNLELIAKVEINEDGNDIWGYVGSDGTEYAIFGTQTSTSIYSLADPTDPFLVESVPGPSSIWRDMKDWNDHIYVTTDQNGTSEGLVIIDMSNAPASVSHTKWQPMIEFSASPGDTIRGPLDTCHNIYIDENGIGYLAGCENVGVGGVIMIDLNQDPNLPVVLGIVNDNYAHDAYVRGDTLYASEISANPGQLTMYDVSDKLNPTALGSVVTSFSFCHNTWISDDGKYAFTTDERPNAFVDSYDITDPENMILLDKFQPLDSRNNEVIPHNTHYKDGYLITSWYTDGVVITDVSNPDIMVEVGHYDSFDGPHGDFNGCWGAYPWLPSGIIIASNISGNENGGTLLILQPTYERASFLRGMATDADTGLPVSDVTVEILDTKKNEAITDALGNYGTGVSDSGIFDVRFDHPDYEGQTHSTTILSGETTILHVQLAKSAVYTVTGNTVKSADTAEAVPNASMIFINDERVVELETDANGEFEEPIINGTYDVYTGAWGYLHKLTEDFVIDNNVNITVELDRGYQDDFLFDLGWTVSGDAETGQWERAKPNGTSFNGQDFNPGADIEGDFGEYCYATGNGAGGAGADDVDDGETHLLSAPMDLTWYQGPKVEYNAWFANGGGQGSPANDSLNIYIDNGTETVLLESIITNAGIWRPVSSYFLPDYTEVTDNMRMIVSTGDYDQGHLVEAGFDGFLVVEGESSSIEDVAGIIDFKVLPNPFNDNLRMNVTAEANASIELRLININGQVLINKLIEQSGDVEMNTSAVPSGTYILQVTNGESTAYTKLIKQ